MSQDELTKFIAASDEFDREVEEQLNESKKRREKSLQYRGMVDEKLLSEMAEIKVKIDQVCSDAEENGHLFLNAFQSRSAKYENKLKNESEKLNKTSRDEIYGDEFHKFEAEKEKFMAWLVETRNMGKNKLGTIDDHIKRVNYCIKRRKKVYDDATALVKLDVAVIRRMKCVWIPQPQHQHHRSLPPRGAV